MKILWITNIPFGKLMTVMGLPGENTIGSWLNSSLAGFIGNSDFEVMVATVGRTDTVKLLKEGNVTYCLLPGGFPGEYRHLDGKNLRHWKYVQATFQPDLIHVWGTEFTHGYAALRVMRDVPSVIYIQGLLEAIARYYLSGMSRTELRGSLSFRDVLKHDWITREQKTFARRSGVEAEMMRLSNHVIVENQWCAAHCLRINPQNTVHYCELTIKDDFYRKAWTLEQVRPFAIMCNAAGYPIKGLHMLLKALALVVKRHPGTMLYIPGEHSPLGVTFKGRLRERGYTKFIRQLIGELGLEKHLTFLGPQTSEQMADQMATCNVFALPSSIENHSSTLIEAMIVGAPCVAAAVGGIPEYLHHDQNGLSYRFEEYELLADHISDLFAHPERARRLGEEASRSMRAGRSPVDLQEKLVQIYRNVLAANPG